MSSYYLKQLAQEKVRGVRGVEEIVNRTEVAIARAWRGVVKKYPTLSFWRPLARAAGGLTAESFPKPAGV